jgi:hypothetical protein
VDVDHVVTLRGDHDWLGLEVRSGQRAEVGEDLVRAALDAGQRVVAGNVPRDIGRKDLFPHLVEIVLCVGGEEPPNESDIRVLGHRRHP